MEEFVISKNLHRRHLDESQRAMVAAKLPGLKWGRPSKEDKAVNLPLNKLDDLASKFNVAEKSIRSARAVREKGAEELIEAIFLRHRQILFPPLKALDLP